MQSVNDEGYSIDFELESVSPTWDYNIYTAQFSITNDPIILNSQVTIVGTDLSNNNGWDMVTSKTSGHPACGIGIYKLKTNIYDTFIYIDFRECQFALGSQAEIDTWFRYVYDEHAFYWNDLLRINQWNKTNTGQLIKIWQIKNTIPNTYCIGSTFWTNALAIMPFNYNEYSAVENLRPVWGPNPNQNNISKYYLYRNVNNGGFTKIGEFNNQIFDYVDNSVQYSISPSNSAVSYKVTSFNGTESGPTNIALPNYYIEFNWNNGLILTKNGTHPKLVWVPNTSFNATHYRIYRAVSNYPVKPPSLNYSLISFVSSSTFEYTDYAVTILPGYQYAYYYVVGWNGTSESSKTNYVNTPAEFHKQLVKMPSEYSLSQNFPNPFNPSTKISWQSPVSGWQTLKVYDVLGNEVATLVNEWKEAGSYEVEFSAKDELANGVYLYRLQIYPANSGAGSFVETKKMILMK